MFDVVVVDVVVIFVVVIHVAITVDCRVVICVVGIGRGVVGCANGDVVVGHIGV